MSEFTLVSVVQEQQSLCKEIGPDGATEIHVPYHVSMEALEFHSTQELFEVLDELRARRDLCVVRGEPIPGRPEPCRRLSEPDSILGDAATLREVPRDWVMLDFDSIDAPAGLYFAQEPARGAEYARSLLPAEFRNVQMVWRASSSAGVKPGIRVHLWARISHALTGAQVKQWLADAPIDLTVFRTIQPHFTADPIFVGGMVDSMASRIGLLDGDDVVQVPQAIIDCQPTKVMPNPTGGMHVDQLVRRALTKWVAENAAWLADFECGSTRYPCPVCGSSDGIAVREDGRWNCHGAKHADCDVGTDTGNVFVGHPCEFKENIPRGQLRAWLAKKYPECFEFGKGVVERVRAANAEALAESLSSIVEGGPTDVEKPSVRELERAAVELKKAAAVVKGNPAQLVDVAAAMGRFVPLFLAHKQVHETLLDAVLESGTMIVARPEAEQQILQGMLVGREEPHIPRQKMTAGLSYDEQGRLVQCYANVLALVSEIGEPLAWDERGLKAVLLSPPVWWEDDDRPFPRDVEDADHSLCAAFLAGDRFRYPHASPAAVADAMNTLAHGHLWDPVREYLDGLTWEGSLDEARELLGSIWTAWAGAVDNAYSRAVSMRWMIAAVQRTYEPGCTQREVLTLIGDQNIGKSRMLQALCADPAWFTDTCDADGTKDSREILLGAWIVELAELDKHIREERTGAFKNFLSTPSDKFRRAYGRTAGSYPRRCIFAGTTNEDCPFKDRTGNTRFNVVHVTRADPAAVAEARDELWAAAVALYQAGEPGWLQGAEREAAVALQNAAYARSTVEELVEDLWMQPAPKLDIKGHHGVDSPLGFAWAAAQLDGDRMFQVLTTQQIMDYLGRCGIRVNNATNQMIAHVCKRLDLERGRVTRALPSLNHARGYWKPGFTGEKIK